MKKSDLARWVKRLRRNDGQPIYSLIPDLIAEDIDSGRLRTRDRLPTLRALSDATGINYTTAARAYNEAKIRGLIDSHPGSGTFVKGKVATVRPSVGSYEMTMNLVVEPGIPTLIDDIRDSAHSVIARKDIYSLLRYQAFGGTPDNKEAALLWLRKRLQNPVAEQLLICPGIHSALVGLVSTLVEKEQLLCVESLVYPGIKSIAAQLGVKLHSLQRDSDGPLIKPFEAICKKGRVAAIYLNPTIHNPTTSVMSRHRREALAEVCLRYSIPIIEDDAYTMLAEKPPITLYDLAPELSWYITGTSKCFGPGIRSAFVHTPSKRHSQRLSAAMRALHVMSSPLSDAMLTQWILDGVADQMVQAVRREAQARLQSANEKLSPLNLHGAEGAFHLWLALPKDSGWAPSELAAQLRELGVSAVSSAAFATDNNPPDAVRLCCGGPITRAQWQEHLQQTAELISNTDYLITGLH